MQQPSSSSSRHSRADRTTTSCTECRRRKQKCNQGQPCNNCFRRFPQPKCEYIHKNPNGRQQTQGLPNMAVFSAQIGAPLQPPVPSQGAGTGSASTKTLATAPRRSVPSRHEGDAPTRTTLSSPTVRYQAPGPRGATKIRSRQGRQAEQGEASKDDTDATDPAIDRVPGPTKSAQKSANLWLLAGSLVPISDLPLKPTKLNAMLVKTFVQHLHRFKGALDGHPEPDNPYVDQYAPWCFQSPLLAPVAVAVAATSLVQLRLMPAHAAIALKGQAIHTLNAYLRNPASATDEAISAVSQLILNDWYFGETRDMQAHLRGLRELVRLCGGFDEQGVNRLVSKTALLTDCYIALSLENSPLNVPEFVFHEPLPEQLKPSYNTPFVTDFPYQSFGKSQSLDLHPATARILDDIRYLFSVVVQLSQDSTPSELEKVQQTAKLTRDNIERMPDTCPEAPSPLSGPPTTISSMSGTSSSRQSASLSPRTAASISTSTRESSSDLHKTLSSSSSAQLIPQSLDPSHFIVRSQNPSTPRYVPDFIYATVRQTALLYTQAVATRSPLSAVCSVPQCFLVWSMAFRVPLKEWHQRLGMFLWVIIAILPTATHTPFATMAKSMLHIGSVQVSLDHWDVAIGMLRNAVKVVAWLTGGRESGGEEYSDILAESSQAKG